MSDSYEQKRLHDAARSGNIEECKRLLDEGHQPNAFDDLGKTPLHYAAEGQHLEAMSCSLVLVRALTHTTTA